MSERGAGSLCFVRVARSAWDGATGATGQDAPGPVLVVDYGAQYAQLIARRVREAHVYSEIVPHTMPVPEIVARRPSAIILSGGPESVYAEGAPRADPALFTAGVPVLGICYGLQAMAVALDGSVGHTDKGEFGRTEARIDPSSELLAGLPERLVVWMSHRDAAVELPEGFRCTAWSDGAPIAAFEDPGRRLYGVQWHPEVVHSEMGQRVIETFLHRCAGIATDVDDRQYHRGVCKADRPYSRQTSGDCWPFGGCRFRRSGCARPTGRR